MRIVWVGGAAAPRQRTMRQLTSMRRGPREVYLSSTWNTPCDTPPHRRGGYGPRARATSTWQHVHCTRKLRATASLCRSRH